MPAARAQAPAPRNPVRHGGAVHAERRERDAVDPEGEGRDFKLSPTLEPLADVKDHDPGAQQPVERRRQGRRRPLRQGSAHPHLHHDHEDPGVDICNGISMDQVAAQRVGDQTPLPSLELASLRWRRGRQQRRLHARLRIAHRLERADDAAGARDQSAVRSMNGCSVPAGRRAAIGEDWTRCCSTACWATRSDLRGKSARPTGSGSTSTCR